MDHDTDFKPRLGRMRAGGSKRARKYLGRVLAAANLARGGAAVSGKRSQAFTGSRIGRGAGVGRLLARRGRASAFARRRVVVKASIVRLAGKGAAGAAAYLRYLQRDGTTRNGEPGYLYGADTDQTDGRAFRDRALGDRHQFRFIVSAEDGAEYEDLKPLTRRLMARAEQDLGTRLDWVAVDHFNTGHPHMHIVVRGKDMRGADLVIARDYLTTGLRERASELVDLDLGPRSIDEIESSLRREVQQERLTSLDRALLRDADAARVVTAAAGDAFGQAVRAGRLAKLGRLGLAEHVGGGKWRLDQGFEETLRRMGERDDIIRTMQREFSERGIGRPPAEQAIFDPAAPAAAPLVGRVVGRGLADEHADHHYLLVDGVDGRGHYVPIGRGAETEMIPEESVVRIVPRAAETRPADRTIAAVAACNGGLYSVDAHLRYDPNATEDFAQTHVRRLEAMRRTGVGVTRMPSGEWTIGEDHLARAATYEARLVRDRPVAIEVLADRPLGRLVAAEGATWLDRALTGGVPERLREAGFGAELRDHLERRRQRLMEQGLATQAGDRTLYPPDLLATLQQRELVRTAGALSDELSLPYAEARSGDRIEGVVRRRLDLASGRFALIERAHDFTLVPWRPALERQVGKSVSGLMRSDGISWTVGRQRGPSMSI